MFAPQAFLEKRGRAATLRRSWNDARRWRPESNQVQDVPMESASLSSF
jgi:hypothetical protein